MIDAGQAAPCWTTRDGKYVFTANAGSRTISRLIGTGNHVFVDSPVAATITTGGGWPIWMPREGDLGVIDHANGQSHLSLFTYNAFGELTPSGPPIDLGVANANGVAIMARRRVRRVATTSDAGRRAELRHLASPDCPGRGET